MLSATETNTPQALFRQPAARLRALWARHGARMLRGAVVLMSALALAWLGYESWRLLFLSTFMGAVDLHLRFDETNAWFARQTVYCACNTAVYPPGTYALLWPFTGWLDWTSARFLWGLTTVVALAWLCILFVRESGAQTRVQQAFVLLLPLATYPVGAAIGNGQLITLQLPLIISAVLILKRDSGLRSDLIAALLLVVALIKPTNAAPFFWAAFFVGMRWRALTLAVLAYAALTLYAATFQGGNALGLVITSLVNGSSLSALTEPQFYGDVHVWLNNVGLIAWAFPVSALLLLVLGGWTFLNRRADIWILLAVAGIVARLWTYHQWYDDALLLPALLALYRIARAALPGNTGLAAGVLLGLNLLFMLAPGGLHVLPYPLNVVYTSVQSLLWLAMLAFLMLCARRMPLGLESSPPVKPYSITQNGVPAA